MTADWENTVALALFAIFGTDWILGLILLAVFSIGVLVMRPPPMVSVIAIGVFIVLIFGTQVGSVLGNSSFGVANGGLGLGITAVVGIAILAAIIVYFGVKRVLRDY
jgi:hypothetical protein